MMRPVKFAMSTLVGACGLAILPASYALADPVVTNAAVSTQQGQSQINVTGTGFGAQGPNVVVYDSFEDAQGSQAQWNDGTLVPRSVARTGNQSHLGVDTNTFYQFEKNLGGDYDEIFLSYWVKLGTDHFPGSGKNDGTPARQFPSISSWKFSWIFDGTRGFESDGQYDLCIPTHTGGGTMQIAGNDGAMPRIIDNRWWSWDEWVRISTHVRRQSGSYGFFQTVSLEHGVDTVDFGNNSPFFPGVTDTFNILTLPGWARDSRNPVEVFYDDVYVAVGDGAPARIEIANSANYNNATVIDIARATSWSDNQITAVLPTSSGLESNGTGYLFVFDAAGRRNSLGYPLCQDCPEPPAPN